MARYGLFIILLLLVLARQLANLPNYHNGQMIRISSKIYSEPIRYDNAQQITAQNLRVYLPLYPEINYGDRVVIEGQVDGSKLKEPRLLDHEIARGILYRGRQKIVNFFKKSLPEPHASLVAGITIGSKESIPHAFWEDLKRTSTAHVVVASGMNVTIVASFLVAILTTIWERKTALIFATFGIWLYAVVSGFDAPIVRATLMGTIAFGAQEAGRVNSALRALVISVLVMLVVWPLWISDTGFWLSFLATGSLILFESKVYKKLYLVPVLLKEDLATTLSAQIGVTPLLYLAFGTFNILSPLYNVLILWTVPLITIIGMFTGLLSLVFPLLASKIILIVMPLTYWFSSVVGF